MNFKKFISVVSALAITASFAVTASAAAMADMEVPADHEGAYTVTNQPIDVSFNEDYQIVYEADIYVGAGDYAQIFYNGGYNSSGVNGTGPVICFDAREDSYAKDTSIVSIWKDDGAKAEINSNNHFARYYAGHTVHVTIVTDVINSTYIGKSYITLSPFNGDEEAFMLVSNRRRYPTNTVVATTGAGNRNIEARHLGYLRKFAAVDLTVSGTATIKNASFSLRKIAVTQAAELVDSFNADNGAAAYSAIIENDSINSLSNVTVTAKTNDAEPETKTATDTITTLAPGSTVVLGIVIENKTADDLASVTVNLK